MSFLKRLLGKGSSVPDWAGHMSISDFEAFRSDLAAAARSLGIAIEVDWNQGIAHLPDEMMMGLMNLTQTYRQVVPEDRRELIADWIRRSSSPPGSDLSPEEMRQAIRARVQPDDFVVHEKFQTWTYPICDGLVGMIAIDLPDAVVTTSVDKMEAAGLTQEEAWEIGLQNLRREPFEVESLTMPSGTTVRLYSGESIFVASHVLRLDELVGEQDAYIFLPTRHQMMVLLREEAKSEDDLGRLAYTAGQWYSEGPGSISPACFAWKEGQLTRHWQPGE